MAVILRITEDKGINNTLILMIPDSIYLGGLIMLCPKCKKEIAENNRFCNFCGALVQKTVTNAEIADNTNRPNPQPQGMICKKCGEKIPNGMRVCNNCGAVNSSTSSASSSVFKNLDVQSSGKTCPNCGRVVPLTEGFCSHCGRDMSKSQSKIVEYIPTITMILAIISVIMCFFPLIATKRSGEGASTFKAMKIFLEEPQGRTLGILCVMIIAFPIIIAIVSGIAKQAWNTMGHSIACSILGVAQLFCLYKLNEGIEDVLRGSEHLTIVITLFVLVAIAITVLSAVSAFLKK